jgi:hypothetical protein
MRRKHDREREHHAGRGRDCGLVLNMVPTTICEVEGGLAESRFTPSKN